MPKESAPGLSFISTTLLMLSFLNWIISKYLNTEQMKDMLAVKESKSKERISPANK